MQAAYRLRQRSELHARLEGLARGPGPCQARAMQLALDGFAHRVELPVHVGGQLRLAERGEVVRGVTERGQWRLERVGEVAGGMPDAPEAPGVVPCQATQRIEDGLHLGRRRSRRARGIRWRHLAALQPAARPHCLVQRRQSAHQQAALQRQQRQQRQRHPDQQPRAEAVDGGVQRTDILGDLHHDTAVRRRETPGIDQQRLPGRPEALLDRFAAAGIERGAEVLVPEGA